MNKEMKLGIYKFIKEVNPDYAVKFQKYDLECDILFDKKGCNSLYSMVYYRTR